MTSRAKREPLAHSSGALKMPGTPRLPEPRIWFPKCASCHTGNVRSYDPSYDSPRGEWHQCPCCENRYFQWHKEQHRIRYVVTRPNYPIKLRIDPSKSLEKSAGRIFYHEIDYAKDCERTYVEAYALDTNGKIQERLRIEGNDGKSFPTLVAAQLWISEQLGGSLRTFWLS